MQKIIHPSLITGSISAPASKSMMQRAVAAAILSIGQTVIKNYTPCNDSDTAIGIARDFGCNVIVDGSTVTIARGLDLESGHSKNDNFNRFNTLSNTINCGESGLGIRMFTPIAALSDNKITLTGEGSLKKRPISMLEEPLRSLGVTVETNNGFIPINVKGPLRGGHTSVDGSISSQMLTGLLLALPCAIQDSELIVKSLTSKPYIEMTLQLMRDFGVEAIHEEYKIFKIRGNQKYHPKDYSIEGDWSAAAFLLVAGALGGELQIHNLKLNTLQADVAILNALQSAGAKVSVSDNGIKVAKSQLTPFNFDATDCPDLFPPLVALASHCKGDSMILGVGRLKHKESNRGEVLKKEFAKLGTEIEIEDDMMIIKGGTLKGGHVHANNDHRIAMSTAVAAIASNEPVVIDNAECISKSYPGFYNDIESIGVKLL